MLGEFCKIYFYLCEKFGKEISFERVKLNVLKSTNLENLASLAKFGIHVNECLAV
jgi:hypothetical protein